MWSGSELPLAWECWSASGSDCWSESVLACSSACLWESGCLPARRLRHRRRQTHIVDRERGGVTGIRRAVEVNLDRLAVPRNKRRRQIQSRLRPAGRCIGIAVAGRTGNDRSAGGPDADIQVVVTVGTRFGGCYVIPVRQRVACRTRRQRHGLVRLVVAIVAAAGPRCGSGCATDLSRQQYFHHSTR